ncbi:MAG TPA: hypothetical protein VIV60_30580 [Polyangiaceae bacterium]
MQKQRMGGLMLVVALTSAFPAVRAEAAPVAATSQGVWADSDQARADNDRAREWFRLGVNAMRAGRLVEAQQLLSEAWQLRRTYDVAASLAQVESELGHNARAAALLDFCMTHFAPIESDKNFKQLGKAFDEVRQKVGLVDLSTLPDGTEIRADGESVGSTPLLLPMYLDPGIHELEFSLTKRTTKQEVLVKPGVQHRIAVNFNAAKQASAQRPKTAAKRPHPKPSEQTPPRRPTLPYYIGAALFVTGVTSATVYAIMEHNARIRSEELRDQLGTSGCYTQEKASSSGCNELAEKKADRAYDRTMATFGVGLAATALAATALYWLWPERDVSNSKTISSAAKWEFDCSASRFWIGASGALPW